MRSDDVGLQARLKEINEDLVYTWCYAHKLNLGVSSSVSCALSAKNLFGLLQSTHNFCSESYKRNIEWQKVASELKGHKKLLRFENFGKTRWYSHDRSLKKIFKSYDDTDTDVFLALLRFLYNVKTSVSFDSKATFEASVLLDNYTKMETNLTAFTYLKIFDVIGPASKYLQTKGFDMMAALKLVQAATSDIKNIRDSFDELREKAIRFARTVNDSIGDEIDVSVQEVIPTSRVRRVKRQAGEITNDEPILDDLERYRVNQFLVICDTTYQSLCSRFDSSENRQLIEEMTHFHPDNFAAVAKQKTLQLTFLSRVLKVDSTSLEKELKHFCAHFASLSKMTVITDDIENLDLNDSDEDVDVYDTDEDDKDEEKQTHKCKTLQKPCNKCLACCYMLLCKLNLHISTYTNLHRAYEYFMTLPCTEVACERAFSKLKIIKSRLRSALQQELLEPLL